MTAIKRAKLNGRGYGKDPNDLRDHPEVVTEAFDKAEAPDPLGWAEAFMLNGEEMSEIKHAKWIIENVVISGHLVIVVAESNGGKTTIFATLVGEMVAAGYRVFYCNVDISAADVPWFVEKSKRHGWAALLPDLKRGLNVKNVVEQLRTMNDSGDDLSSVVFIFDTLKKVMDVLNKKDAKDLLALFRSLTGKGMTVILLGHTNKYKDVEGNPIFEGTVDIRTDCDELIYFIPKKHDDKSMTVSTKPDKVRGVFKPITFHISAARIVTRATEYVDTETLSREEDQWRQDETIVQAVTEALDAGRVKQTEIIDFCKDAAGLGRRTVERVLQRYSSGHRQQWERQRAFEKNAIRYRRIQPGERTNRQVAAF